MGASGKASLRKSPRYEVCAFWAEALKFLIFLRKGHMASELRISGARLERRLRKDLEKIESLQGFLVFRNTELKGFK